MQTPIARIVALTCHANAKLRGLRIPTMGPDHSTMKFVASSEFLVSGPWTCVARDESEFLGVGGEHDYLRTCEARSAHLDWSDEGAARPYRTAGSVGGGGLWTMTTYCANGEALQWRTREQIGDRAAKDGRIWRTTTYVAWVDGTEPPAVVPPALAERALRAQLVLAEKYAAEHAPQFAGNFVRALRSLDGKRSGHHQDLVPPGALEETAMRIIDAVQVAWVFGAMGSWNDMGEPTGDFEKVSDTLHRTLIAVLVAATNSGAPG
jgi:hypothetical protein